MTNEKKIFTEEEKFNFKKAELLKLQLALTGLDVAKAQILNKIRWLEREIEKGPKGP